MSHLSMSINQIIQTNDTVTKSTSSSPTTPSLNENKLTGKVKIFYTFKGSDNHCLCTFELKLDEFGVKKWIGVPLRQCLNSVCTSCPDQLVSNNTAIYSANFEESATVENWSPLHDSKSNIIWEGHGLLSNILSDDHPSSKAQVTGKLINDSNPSNYDFTVEVLIQLHPIRHSPVPQYNEQQYLPPMRSIWSKNMNNECPPNNNHTMSDTSPLLMERPSPQRPTASHSLSSSQQMHLLQFPPNQHPQQHRDDTRQRIPSFSSQSSSRETLAKDEPHQMYLQTLESKWPGSRYDATNFDQETLKRRKISEGSTSSAAVTAAAVADLRHYTSSPSLASKVNRRHSPNTSATTTLVSTSPTTDTYYHQSRRKKRDTKPPNANDIRSFIEIEKKQDGQYVLPAEVDSWTVLDLGSVIWDRAAFHNQRYIYPVGYKVKKWYRSMVDPHSDTQYTCEILDGGDEPVFQLNADDNPSECWRGPTPTTVWTIAVRRAFAIRNMDYGHNPVGPDFFGLRKNTIAKMIQDLPNADKCKNYIWQNFEAVNNSKGKPARRSNTRLSSSSSTGSVPNLRTLTTSFESNVSTSLKDRSSASTSPPIKSEAL